MSLLLRKPLSWSPQLSVDVNWEITPAQAGSSQRPAFFKILIGNASHLLDHRWQRTDELVTWNQTWNHTWNQTCSDDPGPEGSPQSPGPSDGPDQMVTDSTNDRSGNWRPTRSAHTNLFISLFFLQIRALLVPSNHISVCCV